MPRGTFDADELNQSTGLYEGPVKIINSRFAKATYNNKAEKPATALIWTVEHLDADDNPVEEDLIFSVGAKGGWEPSEDGELPSDSEEGAFITSANKDAKIHATSAYGYLLTSLKGKLKVNPDRGAEDFNDRYFMIQRAPAPTRDLPNRRVVVVTEVLQSVPWEKPVQKLATAGRR